MSRTDLALFMLEHFKEYILPAGSPFSDQRLAIAFTHAFLMVETFQQVEVLNKDELLKMLQPMMQPQMPPARMQVVPNGAPTAKVD